MNRFTQSALIATGLVLSFSTNATTSKTDSELFTECKTSINAQFENVERIKLANISSRRGVFKAKMKVMANGQRSNVLCTIADNQVVALTCSSGSACPESSIAAN